MTGVRVAGLVGVAVLGVAVAISGAVPSGVRATAAADTAITSRSIAFFEAKLVGDPANPLVAGALVARYLKRFRTGADLADVRRAERLADRALPLASDTAAALARLSVVYLTQHKFAEAYAAARGAIQSDSGDQDALGAWFDAAMATGRYAEAESTLARLRPGGVEFQLRRAHFLGARGRADGAFYALDRACVQLERAAVAPLALAWCLTELAKVERGRSGAGVAEALLQRALAIQPGYRGAVEGLADLAYGRGAWRRAERLYRRIVADAHPDLYLRLAEVRAAQGDAAGATAFEREFLRVALAPDAEPLYAPVLSAFYAERGAPDSAVAVARRDVARRPIVESWDVLGWALFRRGDFAAALEASDRAFAWGAPSPTMEYHRSRILTALGRDAEAAPLLARATADAGLLEPYVQREVRRAEVAR